MGGQKRRYPAWRRDGVTPREVNYADTGKANEVFERQECNLDEYRRGKVHSTRRFGQPLEVIVTKEVTDIAAARALERKLKFQEESETGDPCFEPPIGLKAQSVEQPRKRPLAKNFGVRGWFWVRAPVDPISFLSPVCQRDS